jgi:hypothetical protein
MLTAEDDDLLCRRDGAVPDEPAAAPIGEPAA